MRLRPLDSLSILVRLAYRTIVRRGRRSAIVAATGAVGMMCVVVSQGFVNGMYDSMVLVAIDSGLGHVQIRPKGYLDSRTIGMELTGAAALEKRFRDKLPAGVRFAPRMEREAMLRLGAEARGVVILGIEPDREAGVSAMPKWLVRGTALPSAASAGDWPCQLGQAGARFLDVDVGDWVVLSTGGRDGATRSIRCHVVGIFHSPSRTLDERIVLMSRADLSRLRNDGRADEVSYFVFRGPDHEGAAALGAHLKGVLARHTDAEIAAMGELEPSIVDLFQIYDQVTILLYVIILGGFGLVLFESVTMSIFERVREIGIIHAIGAPPALLFFLVILEALLLTLAGAAAGMLGGGGIVVFAGFTGVDFSDLRMGGQTATTGLSIVHPFLTMKDLVVGFTIAGTISFFSSLYPALRAVRISPVRAIQGRP